jgi:two-component system KDP operon response regulator KdpE
MTIDEAIRHGGVACTRARDVAPFPRDQCRGTMLDEGDFRIDLESREVQVKGKVVHLSPKEFDLLLFFIRNSGKVLTHHTLLGKIWGGDYTEQTEYLRVFVRHLRKKIDLIPPSHTTS